MDVEVAEWTIQCRDLNDHAVDVTSDCVDLKIAVFSEKQIIDLRQYAVLFEAFEQHNLKIILRFLSLLLPIQTVGSAAKPHVFSTAAFDQCEMELPVFSHSQTDMDLQSFITTTHILSFIRSKTDCSDIMKWIAAHRCRISVFTKRTSLFPSD